MASQSLTGNEVLAIDAGTQGISVILWCPDRKLTLGVGEASYEHDYCPDLPDGRLEQKAAYWSDALSSAMTALRKDVSQRESCEIATVAGIGITGHMHCMVRRDQAGNKPFGCDMWNDPRGVAESEELSKLFGEQLPSRWTACHILASMRSDPNDWQQVSGVTVTSGSIFHDLTGEWVLGPGDASGMFGNLDANGQIDRAKLRQMDQLVGNAFKPLEEMVPKIVPAGEVAGHLSEAGAQLLGGLPVGIPVASPEGDQQSVLVGAAVDELELALSAGTSFAGNLASSATMKATNETVNVLQTPDRKTMLMICARNGTVGFANYVSGLCQLTGEPFQVVADRLTDLAAELPNDLYQISMLPFFQGENVCELPDSRASIRNAGLELLSNPGVMTKLLLEGPCMIMRYGIEQLKPQIGDLRQVLLTGGSLKSKKGYAPQLYADLLGVPVVGRTGDEEGTAKGAAILAAYMARSQAGSQSESLASFAKSQVSSEQQVWEPRSEVQSFYDDRYNQFEEQVKALQNA